MNPSKKSEGARGTEVTFCVDVETKYDLEVPDDPVPPTAAPPAWNARLIQSAGLNSFAQPRGDWRDFATAALLLTVEVAAIWIGCVRGGILGGCLGGFLALPAFVGMAALAWTAWDALRG